MIQNIIYSVTIIFTSTVVHAQLCPGTPGQVQWDAWAGLYDDEFSELTALPYYPYRPEVSKALFKLESPVNYNNYFGSRIRGYIQVPTTTTATFNVTGNRRVIFYLSSDVSPDNKAVIATVPDATEQQQHNIYPEQTSSPFVLQANTPYYFELIHVDSWGGDHATVWWQTDLVDPVNWNIITSAYLLDIGCEDPLCPEPGTPCDDGDPTTINDIGDGYCHCFGEKTTTNNCIGDKSKVTGYRYEGIPGGDLNSLYEAPNFPGTPAFSEQLDHMGRVPTNAYDDIGHSVQAFLTVPVSGNYKFNVTGDDNTILFLSSDETMENRQAHQALVSGWTNTTEHDKYIYQSTSNIYLEKGNYYYFEINHKNGGGGEHFSAFWQTPFTEEGQWKRIPTTFLHDYACEVACIPQGTPCDDGDPFTNNDMYDNNCECVGTPCSGPDCDNPLANYMKYDECSPTDQLDDREENNWISCQTSANPNTSRGNGHWIMYDLGERHELHQTQVWNYNVSGQTQIGFQNVAIDYSDDGTNWSTLGSYNWPQASGGSGYSGFSGPHFNGTYARYVLVTSLDAGGCRGLGKIAFTAVYCPQAGTHVMTMTNTPLMTNTTTIANVGEVSWMKMSVPKTMWYWEIQPLLILKNSVLSIRYLR